MSTESKDIWFRVIGGLSIALISGSLSYGYSQSALGNMVRDQAKDIIAERESRIKDVLILKEADAATKELVLESNHRIDKLADHMDELIKQNTALISLIKAQTQVKGL